MAKVFVTTTARKTKRSPYILNNYERVMRAARHDSVRRHTIVDDPKQADIILFVEACSSYHFDVLRSDLYARYPEKCFVFDSRDYALPLLPGIYMSIPDHLKDIPIYRYGFYIRIFDNHLLDQFMPHSQCEFLFSFVGKAENCARVRVPIINLNHPRAYLADQSNNQADNDSDYVSILNKSKFVLCPRGLGASTWRCFETMRAGRVPVIISDSWVPPPGLRWEEFSLQVPEAEISTIPALLESIESDAETIGLKARQAWQDHFSLTQSFDWIVQTCLEIRPYIAGHQKAISRYRLPELRKDEIIRFLKDYARTGPTASLFQDKSMA